MSEFNLRESEFTKSEKEILWDKIGEEVDKITDKLGKHIEENIRETVVALQIYEFSTSQSCEGHSDKKNASFPWVEIYAPEPGNWKQSSGEEREKLEEEWKKENLIQQQKMSGLLAEFYQGREVSNDARLTFRDIGIFGGFRIQSFGSEATKSLSKKERENKLKIYREEVSNFTEFLKKKFLEK